jgi:hypothetical protein
MRVFFTILFFKFFQFSKSIGNADDDSYAFKSVAILSMFLSINFFSLVAYYKCWIKHDNEIQLSRSYEALCTLAIGILVYLIFYTNQKYERHFEKVIQQSRFKGRQGSWLTIFYLIASIVFLASIIWLKCKG